MKRPKPRTSTGRAAARAGCRSRHRGSQATLCRVRHRLQLGPPRGLRRARPGALAAVQREVPMPSRRRPRGDRASCRPEGFRRTVEAVRRFRAIADAMGVARIDCHRHGGDPPGHQRAAAGGGDRGRGGARGTDPDAGPRRRTLRRSASISGFFRPGRAGRRHGRRQPRGRRGAGRPGRRALGQPAARRPAGAVDAGGRRATRPSAGSTRSSRKALPPALTEPVFYAVGGGWRAFAKAHMADAKAPVRVVARLFAAGARRPATSPSSSGTCRRPSSRACPACRPARRYPAGGGARARPRAQASGAGAGRVLGSRACARAGSTPSLPTRSAISTRWSRARSCSACRVARVPRVRAGPGALDRRPVPRRDAGRSAAAAGGLRALRHRLARPPGRAGGGELPPPAAVPVHRHRPCRARVHRRSRSMPATPALRTHAGCSRRSRCCRRACRRRAMILGRTLLLGYRFSGGVPEILAGARLQIDADSVRLEVGQRGPRARQRGGRRPPQAAGECHRRPTDGSRGGRRGSVRSLAGAKAKGRAPARPRSGPPRGAGPRQLSPAAP